MKKSSYSKKVFNYLNENKFELSSLLLEEEEESKEDEDSSGLFGDDSEDSSEDKSKEEESSDDESSDNESSDDSSKDSESSSDVEAISKAAEDKALLDKAKLINKRDEAAAMQKFGSELDNIQDGLTSENYQPYYSKKGSIQNFIFENEDIEDTEAFSMLKDIESKTTSVPSIVKKSIEYIRHFDSKVNKAQLIYDIAVKGIIETGGKNFEKELEEFDELFHKTYIREFPGESESPVRKYLDNQNYHAATGAQKSG